MKVDLHDLAPGDTPVIRVCSSGVVVDLTICLNENDESMAPVRGVVVSIFRNSEMSKVCAVGVELPGDQFERPRELGANSAQIVLGIGLLVVGDGRCPLHSSAFSRSEVFDLGVGLMKSRHVVVVVGRQAEYVRQQKDTHRTIARAE